MGLSSSKQKTSSKSQSTSTATPTAPGYIQQPVTDYFGQVSALASGGTQPATLAPNANQTGAYAGAANLGTNPGFGQAANATRSLLDYAPDNVTAGQLRDTDMSAYLNPFTNEVIDRSLADLERGRQGAISNTQGQATAVGAFGGSRHGVADSLTNREFFDSAGSLSANLRNAGWNQAMDSARFDIGNRLGADTGNAERGLAGAGLRLNAAGQLGSLAGSEDANTRANLATRAALGSDERAISAENDPANARARWLLQLQELLGINPNALIGQNTNASGSGTSTTTSTPSGISQLGSLLQMGGSLFGMPGKGG